MSKDGKAEEETERSYDEEATAQKVQRCPTLWLALLIRVGRLEGKYISEIVAAHF